MPPMPGTHHSCRPCLASPIIRRPLHPHSSRFPCPSSQPPMPIMPAMPVPAMPPCRPYRPCPSCRRPYPSFPCRHHHTGVMPSYPAGFRLAWRDRRQGDAGNLVFEIAVIRGDFNEFAANQYVACLCQPGPARAGASYCHLGGTGAGDFFLVRVRHRRPSSIEASRSMRIKACRRTCRKVSAFSTDLFRRPWCRSSVEHGLHRLFGPVVRQLVTSYLSLASPDQGSRSPAAGNRCRSSDTGYAILDLHQD